MKKCYLDNDLVYKINDNGSEWSYQLIRIMEYVDIPAFVKLIPGGYVTKFIDGLDLQEDKPFQPRHDIVRGYPLNPIQKQRVIKIFSDIVLAGIKTNFTLADFTKRNIIMQGDIPYLIDYDVIIEGKLNSDYIAILQKMLDYLEIPYKFDGDLERLYESLS